HGHEVVIETQAGIGSGISDEQYSQAGARLVPDAAAAFEAGELVLKVKEPTPSEYPLLRENQVLFTYLHLAASRECTDALLTAGTT
ncbi:alanine dehydrogenase, partial [Salmonella enterica]|nr:alanine dehydrogenase [Salmonella enterica]